MTRRTRRPGGARPRLQEGERHVRLSHAVMRLSVSAPTERVEQHDDRRDEQDAEDDAEGVEHHSSPISQSASHTKPNQAATPALISPNEADCRATT